MDYEWIYDADTEFDDLDFIDLDELPVCVECRDRFVSYPGTLCLECRAESQEG